jgi:hypothetical protein
MSGGSSSTGGGGGAPIPCCPTSSSSGSSRSSGARSAVRAGRRADDADGIARARRRVDLAKHGLGERGPAWWECEEIDRLARAEAALGQLRRLDGPGEV